MSVTAAAQATESRKYHANDPKCSDLGWVWLSKPMEAIVYANASCQFPVTKVEIDHVTYKNATVYILIVHNATKGWCFCALLLASWRRPYCPYHNYCALVGMLPKLKTMVQLTTYLTETKPWPSSPQYPPDLPLPCASQSPSFPMGSMAGEPQPFLCRCYSYPL